MPEHATNRLTDQQILANIWVGIRTGNLFKAASIGVENGEKTVTYTKAGGGPKGGPWTIPKSTFQTRMRAATEDELWDYLNRAAATDTDGEDITQGVFIEPDYRHDLDRMILYPDTKQSIAIGLNKIERKAELEAVWSLSKIEPRTNRCALGFYGEPGTGKTLAAVAVGKKLGKKVYQVDYSQIVSKYVGDTAKHIHEAFKVAKDNDAVLFWDEADAMVSRRVNLGENSQESNTTDINQNRAAVLTCLDAFDGVAIFATNLFCNYDEAFLRRIAQHVNFQLPNETMRIALFKLHLPNMERVRIAEEAWDEIGKASKGFSGGDILNVIINGISAVSMAENSAEWELLHVDLLAEIGQIRGAKKAHAGCRVASNID